MQQNDLDDEPKTDVSRSGNEVRVALSGDWVADVGKRAEDYAAGLKQAQPGEKVVFDLSGIGRLDTLGSLLIVRSAGLLEQRGAEVVIEGESEPHRLLLEEVAAHKEVRATPVRQWRIVNFLVDIGQVMVTAKRDAISSIAFFGEVVAALSRIAVKPRAFRFTSLVNQMEQVAFRGVPIIVLISFLVGCIIAQQGIFQLKTFGATAFVVDLISILTLRELSVLLTAIMIAGRSGSAYTAELGSMKMREEIDALRVMGLNPMEVLVVPRILALVIGLPLLTFISSMAALAGGALTSYFYGGITIEVFLTRLQSAIAINTFFAGILKAPFMAVVIGVIACTEGFAVQGSAESLGRHVTSSVVKAIFMVIVMDGVFAMFFAAINF